MERLDEDARDYQVHISSGQRFNPFSLQSLAYSMYYSLEGKPYTQPEFPSQATITDAVNRNKFNALFAGIVAYAKASEEQRNLFKKSTLKTAGPIAKMSYFIKMRQHV